MVTRLFSQELNKLARTQPSQPTERAGARRGATGRVSVVMLMA